MLKGFVIKLILLLPLSFLLWYGVLEYIQVFTVSVASHILQWLEPDIVQALVLENKHAVIESYIPYQGGYLSSDVEVAKYLISIPLCIALVTSSGKLSIQTVVWLLVSVIFLLFVASWGVVAEVYRILLFDFSHLVPLAFSDGKYLDLYALFYQMSVLIIPLLLPVLLWSFLKKDYVLDIINPK